MRGLLTRILRRLSLERGSEYLLACSFTSSSIRDDKMSAQLIGTYISSVVAIIGAIIALIQAIRAKKAASAASTAVKSVTTALVSHINAVSYPIQQSPKLTSVQTTELSDKATL